MRSTLAALALLTCTLSCAPPAPPATEPAASESSVLAPAIAADNTAALSAAPASGAWVFHGDEGVISACFGAPESECAISLQCEAPTGAITVLYSAELVPDQPTTLRMLTPAQTLDLPARSFNEGLPSINAELIDGAPARDALIAQLSPAQERFAVDANGEITVYPWNDAVARTLDACR